MPRSSKRELFKSEAKILKILRMNARQSLHKIADSLHCSRQKVWRIKKHLEENHAIWGYSAVVDAKKRGRNEYILLLKLQEDPFQKKMIQKFLDKNSNYFDGGVFVECMFHMYGFFDWVFVVESNDVGTVKDFCDELRRCCDQRVEKIELLENVFTIKKSGFLNPDEKNLEVLKMT